MNRKNSTKHSKTDWKKIDAMPDDDIDFSDIPELNDDFFKTAKVMLPKPKIAITWRINSDVLK